MGVSGLTRWLQRRYRLVTRGFADASFPLIRNLYVDFNQLLYMATEATEIHAPVVTDEFFSYIATFLENLVEMVMPTDLVYIAADGVASVAKSRVKRARSFLFSKEKAEGAFDQSVLTVGTPFIDDVDTRLKDFIRRKCGSDPLWSSVKVVYSGFYTPGEGDDKIVQRMIEEPGKSHAVFSNDSDLICSSLRTHFSTIVIIQTRHYVAKKEFLVPGAKQLFDVVHVCLLREYIGYQMGSHGKDLERAIDDFLALTVFLGSDFLPTFKEVPIRGGGFDILINSYKAVKAEMGGWLIEDNAFNRKFLWRLLQVTVWSIPMEGAVYMTPAKKEEMLRCMAYGQLVTDFPELKMKTNEQDFRAEVEKICHATLDGFEYVWNAMNGKCVSWNWMFPYADTPPLLYLTFYVAHESKFIPGEPHSPFLNMLFGTLPNPNSGLPDALLSLTEPPSPISRFYPRDFPILHQGEAWNMVPQIPLIDRDEILAAYTAKLAELPPESLQRNRQEEAMVVEPTATSKPSTAPVEFPSFKGKDIVLKEVDDDTYFTVAFTSASGPTTLSQAKALLNTEVQYDWPYTKRGLVTAVQSGTQTLTNDGTSRDPVNLIAMAANLAKSGITIGNIYVVCEITPEGGTPIWMPVQLLLLNTTPLQLEKPQRATLELKKQ